MTTHARILNLLVEYRKHGLCFQYVPGIRLQAGELPLCAFQGVEVGGAAANMRLYELRAPEQQKKNYRGIPIRKARRYYDGHDGERHHIITYTLDILPELIDELIDFDKIRLNGDALDRHGLKAEAYEDDANGADKPGWAVRLVKQQPAQLSLVA